MTVIHLIEGTSTKYKEARLCFKISSVAWQPDETHFFVSYEGTSLINIYKRGTSDQTDAVYQQEQER